jgi:cysteine desulfurase/selenocysteine lyase
MPIEQKNVISSLIPGEQVINNHSNSTVLPSSTSILQTIRKEFPLLDRPVHGKRLAYLDSAATAQKPQCVIDAFNHYYTEMNANIHRGVHYLSETATSAFEMARIRVQQFLNAAEARECIFVRSTTEAINLIAHSFGTAFIKPGDEVLITQMEHHSNIVPWQMLCKRMGATLKFIPLTKEGELDLSDLDSLLSSRTKLLAITHVSNALGTINPIADIIARAHAKQIPVLVDGAQAAPHLKIDVQALDCDFYTFSGHKAYGPTGIGVLYGKSHWLEQLPPYQGGGEMILKVTMTDTLYHDLPHKFEAGTPAIAAAIALGTALEYLMGLDWKRVEAEERQLLSLATERLQALPGIQIVGTARDKIGVISFTLDGIHPHDIGSIADQYGVALRTGHHCAMPTMDFFGIAGTARASLGIYNTREDIEQLEEALMNVRRIFKRTN